MLAILVLAFVVFRLVPRLGHPGWAVALGLLCAGVAGNLTDRLFRSPGLFRGHVVDFLQLPHWPIFNVADMCITAAAVLIMVLAVVKNVGRGREPGGSWLTPKVVLVPDGLDGERVDAAIARMLGLSRTRAADLIAPAGSGWTAASVVKSDRVRSGAMLEVELEDRTGGRRSSRTRSTGCGSSTTTTTSWWSTSRSGSPPTRASAGTGPTCSPTWPAPASGSPPPACRSDRGSCSGSTSAPPD